MTKRAYSRAFTPRPGARRCAFTFDKVPPVLYDRVRGKAKRTGVSLRGLVLQWLNDWSNQA